MRSIKKIVPFILVFCMVFALCFAIACSTNSKELKSLALDTANAKTEFSLGEEYQPTGLKVTAKYKSGKTEVIANENLSFDTSKYDAWTVGEYEITVSYSSEGTSASASYKVNVDAYSDGLVVTLKEGRVNRYDLTSSAKTVNLSNAATWIEVRKPDENGEVDMSSSPLDRSAYTVNIYKNGEEVADLSAVNRGIYEIRASMYDAKKDFTFEGNTLIVVYDDVNSIAFLDGTTSQAKGLRETMTRTWKFTVTYNSGDTEVVDKTNPYLSISLINPNIAGMGGTATVSYGEPKTFLAEATSIRTTAVNYTLTGDQSNPDLISIGFDTYDTAEVSNILLTKENLKFAEVSIVGGSVIEKGATITLPTGISNSDGSTSFDVKKAYQSGGASSADKNRYIYLNNIEREFEIYIYAKSNGDDDRCMNFETESDYATINLIEGQVGGIDIQGINGVATSYKASSAPYSVHAVSVTGISAENPADFILSFEASINVYYILVVFPELEVFPEEA